MNTIGSNIALYIGGTRTRHGGFGYITSVGVLAGNEIEGDMDRSPASRATTDENPVITLKNAEGYVYYKLWNSSIAPADDVNKPGRLAIGVTMPSNVRLKDNKSPYRLLMEIHDKFLEIGTVKTEGGMTVFRDADLDKAAFVEVLERYPFEPVSIKPEVMKGESIAEIQMPKEKLEDFFRDAQYPEFVGYKAVEVTTRGKNMFPNLVIPRPTSYEVFVNGKSTGRFIQDLNERFNVRLDANDDIKYPRIDFSLGDLLQSANHAKQNQDGTVRIQLDQNSRRINCAVKASNVLYKKHIKYTRDSGDDAMAFVKKGLANGDIRIRLDGEDWNDAIKPSVAKSAIDRNKVDIYPHEAEGFKLSIAKAEIDQLNEEVLITINAIKSKEGFGKRSKEGTGKEDGNRPNSKLLWGFLIGLGVGVLCAIVGIMLWSSFHKEKTAKETVVEQEVVQPVENEQTAYSEAIALPFEQNDQAYIMLQKTGNGDKYRNYLKTYSQQSAEYNEEHFNEIKKRLDQYFADSTEYAQEANNYLGLIQKEFGKIKEQPDQGKSVDCSSVRTMCNNFQLEYGGLSEENDKLVADILKECNEMQQITTNSEDAKSNENDVVKNTQRQALLEKAIEFLNNHDYDGYNRWDGKSKLTQVQRSAIDWILDYSHNSISGPEKRAVIDGIENYLKEIGFSTSEGGFFRDWNGVMEVKKQIDKIISNKGQR